MRRMLTGPLALLLGACGGDASGPDQDSLRLEFAPTSVMLPVGGQSRLEVRVLDPRGRPVVPQVTAWSSEAPEVATVDGTGMVLGVQRGKTRIVAESGHLRATAEVHVVADRISLSPSPSLTTVVPGSRLLVTPRVWDAHGRDIPQAWPAVTWSSADPAIASVSTLPSGHAWVTPGRAGSTHIRATLDLESSALPVTVLGPLTGPSGRLEIVEFWVMELRTSGNWLYLPLIRARETGGGMVDILRVDLKHAGAPKEASVCASLRLREGASRYLIGEWLDTWPLIFDFGGDRAPAGDFHLVVWYNTADGMDAVEATGRIESNSWPADPSDSNWFGDCHPSAGEATPPGAVKQVP